MTELRETTNKRIATRDKRDKFRMNFISSIDTEKEGQILKELEDEQTLLNKENKRLIGKWESKKFPNFRLTGEYLLRNSYKKVIDTEDMVKDLGVCKETIRLYLSELNRFSGFAIRFIPKPKMKGCIELCTESKQDFDKWNGAYSKGLTSRTKRLSDTRKHVEINERMKELERAKTLSKKKKVIKLPNKSKNS